MYYQLSREQRYAIYLGLKEKKTFTAIARQIGCSISTVSREVRRNTNRHGHYIYQEAVELTQIRRERSASNRKLSADIIKQALHLLRENEWSPQQISGWLRKEKGLHISHESIYRIIRSDTSGELKSHTRHHMKYRHHIKPRKMSKASNIPNRVSIHDRPLDADGSRFGDWEMDLVVGKGQKSALLTLTERSTNYLLMSFVPNKKPKTIEDAAWKLLLPFIGNSLKTITTDNGFEFRNHENIARRLKTKIYFAVSQFKCKYGVELPTGKIGPTNFDVVRIS